VAVAELWTLASIATPHFMPSITEKPKLDGKKIICRVISGSSFAALLTMLSVETLDCCLKLASVCFCFVLIPCAIYSVSIWPDRSYSHALALAYAYGLVLMIAVFLVGVFFLALHFGSDAAAALLLSAIVVGIGMCIQKSTAPKESL
jgi:hypothetical protein